MKVVDLLSKKRRKIGTIYCLNCRFKLAELYTYVDRTGKVGFELKVDGHIIPIAEKTYTELGNMYEKIRTYWRRCPRCFRSLSTTPEVLVLKKGEEKTVFLLYSGEVVEWKAQDLVK